MGWRGAAWCSIWLVATFACGGRMLDSGGGGSTGGGGSSSSGGSRTAGGSSGKSKGGGDVVDPATGGRAISSGGRPASAGAPASAGTGPCLCLDVACSEGFIPGPPPPGECCPGPCVLDCRNVACSDIDLDCKPGFHVGPLPDECCPQCVPDKPLPCDEAQEQYRSFREQMVAKYQALGCEAPGNTCSVAGERNRCAQSCGIPVPFSVRDYLEEDLGNFAADTCTQCPKPLDIGCDPQAFSCVNNTCVFEIGAK